MAPTTVSSGIYGPLTIIPTKISLYSASKTTSSEVLSKVPTAWSIKSPTESCSGFVGFEVLEVGYSKCFIPAESTQLILV